jgi:hypothetical protein
VNKKLKRVLPFVAVAGALLVVVCALASTAARAPLLVESDETRQAADGILGRLQALEPASVEDGAFRQALAEAGQAPAVAYTWLFAPDGRVLQGNLAASPGSTAEGMATEETRRLLASLGPGAMDEEQRLLLLAASAMQAEGEHNDVFRHQVRALRAADGTLTGLVGLTYDANPGLGAPSPVYILSLLAGVVALGLYWLSLPLWVWLDARERGERAWVWAVFLLFGNLVALLAYILARAPRSAPARTAA